MNKYEKDSLIFAIDFGTQSVRAAIFNKKGDTVAIEKEKYAPAYHSPKSGYAEQDPDYYLECLAKASRRLVEKNSELLPFLAGVSMSCFRDTAVFLDVNDKILRPAILWLDERQAKASEKLPIIHRILFRLVGMSETVRLNRKRTPAHWVKENQPEIWKKVAKYMNLSTYITMKLVGDYVDSPANYAGHFPINFKRRAWYRSDKHMKGRIFGIPKRLLPRLVNVHDTLGYITEDAEKQFGIPKGLKMFAIGSDKSSETLGLGALSDDVVAISYGTASSVEVTTKKYHDSELFLPAYPSVLPDRYNMEVQVYRGYWMLNWFSQEFAKSESLEAEIQHRLTLDILNEEMLAIPPGSDGLVLQPYWGPGLRRPLAKGAIIGFSDTHTRIHLYRAIIEGIAYALREGMENFEKRLGKKIKEIRIAGGGSQSDAICQITADIFGLPTSRVQTYETSLLGASVAGFLAAKQFASPEEAIKAMVHQTKTFYPNESNHRHYDYLFKEAYLLMYPSLKNIYKNIKEYGQKKN